MEQTVAGTVTFVTEDVSKTAGAKLNNKKKEAPNISSELPSKSGDDLLSHNVAIEREFRRRDFNVTNIQATKKRITKDF